MIVIPEFKIYNNSYFDTYKAIYSLCAHEVTRLRRKFPEGAINDINGYKAGILTKVMYSFHSFMLIIENNHDYSTAATILRSIADNLATYILIYHSNTKEDRELRHYLYLIDGANCRLNALLSIKPREDAPVREEEKQEVRQNVNLAVKDSTQTIEFCKNYIKEIKCYKTRIKEIDYLINKQDGWRYKTLDKYKETYSWKALYPLINGLESSKSFISYLSQFVHGLSSSNLFYDTESKETFEPLIGIGITFLGKVQEFVLSDFDVDKDYLVQGFLKTNYAIDYISCMSPERQQELLSDFRIS